MKTAQLITLVSLYIVTLVSTACFAWFGYEYVVEGYGLHPAICMAVLCLEWAMVIVAHCYLNRNLRRNKLRTFK